MSDRVRALGGDAQRVLIAIALAAGPEIVIADEPTSALDVTVQRKIFDHFEGLVRRRGISLLIADVVRDGLIAVEQRRLGVAGDSVSVRPA
jgi:ABC-type microcin C transport system duplicated ATPase subunit YejF